MGVIRCSWKYWVTSLVVLLVICMLFDGCGKKSQKEYQVGILFGLDPLFNVIDSFKAKMTELGYVEGKNTTYDIQKTDFEPDKMQQILKKFIDNKVDLIFALPTEAALAAKATTQGTGIPVVFSYSSIEGNNLVDNVRQPGGNITGVREPGPDLIVKRLDILHELTPQAKRIYITYKAGAPSVPPTLELLHKASSPLNITLVEAPVATVEELKADLQTRDALDDIGIDAILLLNDPICALKSALTVISKFAVKHKVPVGGLGKYIIEDEWMGRAIIFTYEIYLDDVGKLAAASANKILKGTSAGTIPVVTPEAKLLINYKVAQELGLNVSEGLLSMADKIIH